MARRTTGIDWSQTETYIGGFWRPYRLFGLHGHNGKHIKRWWPGDRSHEKISPPMSLLQKVGYGLVIAWVCLAALGAAIPAEKVPRSLHAIYAGLLAPLAGLYWLAMLVGLVILGLGIVKVQLFPSQKDHERAEKYRREIEEAKKIRDLTVVLWLGYSWQRLYTKATPLYLDRHRDSPPLSADTLPRDRYIYVTLHDLTETEMAELSNELVGMDI